MDNRGNEIHATETEVSGGSKEGVVRWVLIVGLVLVVVFLSVVWMVGAASQPDGADSEPSVSNTIAEEGAQSDRGEPMAPTFDQSTEDQTSQNGLLEVEPNPATSPSDSATPGDAPAGNPSSDAM
ncbi:hypothetical protein [Tsuneonella amylolytica]|uniref:hypothetical protein n=1 Tax=Tsuneonella amylolytica TaxID=2338327 RepID=UPI000EA99C24|nr:hypothetical protein [Tsuneonella amylolytica]